MEQSKSLDDSLFVTIPIPPIPPTSTSLDRGLLADKLTPETFTTRSILENFPDKQKITKSIAPKTDDSAPSKQEQSKTKDNCQLVSKQIPTVRSSTIISELKQFTDNSEPKTFTRETQTILEQSSAIQSETLTRGTQTISEEFLNKQHKTFTRGTQTVAEKSNGITKDQNDEGTSTKHHDVEESSTDTSSSSSLSGILSEPRQSGEADDKGDASNSDGKY